MHHRLAARFTLCQDHSCSPSSPQSNSSKSAQRFCARSTKKQAIERFRDWKKRRKRSRQFRAAARTLA